jgi:hypothetical protein
LIINCNYLINKKWKKMWRQDFFLNNNQHMITQTFSNFPTRIIIPMLGRIVITLRKANWDYVCSYFVMGLPWKNNWKISANWTSFKKIPP